MIELTSEDPIRAKWESAYTGRTDNGLELPVSQVRPGAIVHGSPVGYWPAKNAEEAESAWGWEWQFIALETTAK